MCFVPLPWPFSLYEARQQNEMDPGRLAFYEENEMDPLLLLMSLTMPVRRVLLFGLALQSRLALSQMGS